RTKNAYRFMKRATSARSSMRARSAASTSAAVSRRPRSISSRTAFLTSDGFAETVAPCFDRNAFARRVRNTASAAERSGSAASTRHPSDSKTRRSALTTAVTRRSNGTPPKSVHQATDVFLTSGACSPQARESYVRANEGDSAHRIKATSSTLRASGPSTLRHAQPLDRSLHGSRAALGRRPTTPQNAAGLRSDPPMSVPSAIGSIPHASATAAPPLLPPHVLVVSYGFSVAPKIGLNVCEPAPN